MKLRTALAFSLLSVLLLSSCGGKGVRGNGKITSKEPSSIELPAQANSDEAPEFVSPKQTASTSSGNKITEHPIVNVYLENSGSMDGYVKGGKTFFQQDVFTYLANVRISSIPSKFNFQFINSEITKKDTILQNFVDKLNPTAFRQAGGQRGKSDIADIIDKVLKRTNDSTMSILISDFIFSPGSVSTPEAYLANQQTGIMVSVAEYLEQRDLAIFVYQLSSNFKGTYWDYTNTGHPYEGQRPYYIILMGHPEHVAKLRSAIPNEKFRGTGVENEWCVSKQEFNITYNVLPSLNGSYDIAPPHTIKKIKQGKEDFEFKIGANLSDLQELFGDAYLMNTNNYVTLHDNKPTDEWYIDVTHNTIAKSPSTHNIILKTKSKVTKGEFELAIRSVVPQWVYNMTDNDDRTLDASHCHKTYGLKYMFDGINAAFNAKTKCEYTKMIIKLQ